MTSTNTICVFAITLITDLRLSSLSKLLAKILLVYDGVYYCLGELVQGLWDGKRQSHDWAVGAVAATTRKLWAAREQPVASSSSSYVAEVAAAM